MRRFLCWLGFHDWYSDPDKWIDSFMKGESGKYQCKHCDAEREADVIHVRLKEMDDFFHL